MVQCCCTYTRVVFPHHSALKKRSPLYSWYRKMDTLFIRCVWELGPKRNPVDGMDRAVDLGSEVLSWLFWTGARSWESCVCCRRRSSEPSSSSATSCSSRESRCKGALNRRPRWVGLAWPGLAWPGLVLLCSCLAKGPLVPVWPLCWG